MRQNDGLRALAFLTESCEDFEALTLAVLLAGLELRRQTQILGLLLRAHTNVNHRADHGRQRRSIRELGQVAFPRHEFYSVIRQPSWYISTTTHAIISACWRICRDFLIGHRLRFLAEQLATARDRDRLRPVVHAFDELHGHS